MLNKIYHNKTRYHDRFRTIITLLTIVAVTTMVIYNDVILFLKQSCRISVFYHMKQIIIVRVPLQGCFTCMVLEGSKH